MIQKKEADDLDLSTVFYTNVVFCNIMYFILFLCSPLIARFYNNTSLIPLIRVTDTTNETNCAPQRSAKRQIILEKIL